MDKMIQFYNDTIQYFESNYINLGITLLFLILGFILSNFFQQKIKKSLSKKSPNHLTANFTSQIVGFILKTIVLLTTLYLLGLNAFTNKLLAGAGLLTFVIGFALKDISIRETMVKTPDGKDGFLRYEFTTGIAYENNSSDPLNTL